MPTVPTQVSGKTVPLKGVPTVSIETSGYARSYALWIQHQGKEREEPNSLLASKCRQVSFAGEPPPSSLGLVWITTLPFLPDPKHHKFIIQLRLDVQRPFDKGGLEGLRLCGSRQIVYGSALESNRFSLRRFTGSGLTHF